MSDPTMMTSGAEVVSAVDQAVDQAYATYAAARPNSRRQATEASLVLPAGSTRSVLDFDPFPFRVARAEGAVLHDVDGLSYVDLLGDYTAALLGHDPEPIKVAVRQVLERGWSLGAIADDEHRLAELVCDRFPSIDQVRFTNSGTEANLMAISLARHTTGRSKVVVFDGGYHGGLLYFGSGGEPLQAPYEYVRCRFNDLESVERAFDRHGVEIASLLIEPMMGAGGGIRAQAGFLEGVRQLCTDHGVMLIFDEVMTSRMSIGGAQLRLGVTPDVTTLGKYLGGGMTFGAFGASAEVMAAFDPARGGTLTHGGTFNNNAMTMSAGAAALEQVLTAEALDRLFDRGERLRTEMSRVCAGHDLVVTGWGSILAVHATAGPIDGPHDLENIDGRVGDMLFHRLLAQGFYLARRGFIALSLAVTEEQLEAFLGSFTHVVDSLSDEGILA